MSVFKTAIILALILSIQLLGACSGGTDSNAVNTNVASASDANATGNGVKDNAEELALLVNLPFEAEEVIWKESSDANGKKLLAVLKFTSADSKKIVERIARSGPGETVSVPSERWFPAELITQGELNGDDKIMAAAYPANEFYLAPYSDGKIFHIQNTDFFILEMAAN